jgi:hypothetical protein
MDHIKWILKKQSVWTWAVFIGLEQDPVAERVITVMNLGVL